MRFCSGTPLPSAVKFSGDFEKQDHPLWIVLLNDVEEYLLHTKENENVFYLFFNASKIYRLQAVYGLEIHLQTSFSYFEC
jgi:hypothetical protein